MLPGAIYRQQLYPPAAAVLLGHRGCIASSLLGTASSPSASLSIPSSCWGHSEEHPAAAWVWHHGSAGHDALGQSRKPPKSLSGLFLRQPHGVIFQAKAEMAPGLPCSFCPTSLGAEHAAISCTKATWQGEGILSALSSRDERDDKIHLFL